MSIQSGSEQADVRFSQRGNRCRLIKHPCNQILRHLHVRSLEDLEQNVDDRFVRFLIAVPEECFQEDVDNLPRVRR
jgi:hypothetical protein